MSKGLKYALYGIWALDVLGLILAYIFAGTVCCDEFEHLRMSYLVSQGYMPYRDFFEHHHPLLWYMFAPLMKILPQNFTLAYYLARGVAFLFSCGTFYFIYLIFKNFFNDGKLFIYFFIAVMVFYPSWYGYIFFKPDVFERCFYFMGLYYFLKYEKSKIRSFLTMCGLCFTISFLFLQTAVFEIIPIIILLMYMLYKDNKLLKDYLIAAFPSVILLSVCAIILYATNSWEDYYRLNWVFNGLVFNAANEYVSKGSIIHAFCIHLAAGFAAFIWMYRSKINNKTVNIIFFLFVCSVIQHLYFTAFYAHYLIPAFILCSILVSYAVRYILSRENKVIVRLSVAFLILCLILNFVTLAIKNNVYMQKQMRMINQNSEDIVITVSGNLYAIYNPVISYYVMSSGISVMDNVLFNRDKKYDINELIKKYRPKYLDYDNSEEEHILSENNRGKYRKISPENLQHYEQLSSYLWQRKDTLLQ